MNASIVVCTTCNVVHTKEKQHEHRVWVCDGWTDDAAWALLAGSSVGHFMREQHLKKWCLRLLKAAWWLALGLSLWHMVNESLSLSAYITVGRIYHCTVRTLLLLLSIFNLHSHCLYCVNGYLD